MKDHWTLGIASPLSGARDDELREGSRAATPTESAKAEFVATAGRPSHGFNRQPFPGD
jgi:hypothetical protein